MSDANPEYRDALPIGPSAAPHRRGAGLNPGNRFEVNRFHLDGDFADYDADQEGGPAKVPLTVIPDDTRTIINKVAPTSDVPFDYTVNPYRGCEHGCIYCFARPYHEFMGFSCGLDFETKIVAKHNAAELLRKELAKPSWKADAIVMSASTDVYQPLEAKLGLTRQCLEVLAETSQPVSTMTKGALVLRDLDLWSELAEKNAGRVTVTIVTLDDQLAKQLEPRAASPAQRLRMVRKLSEAGVRVNVNVSPIIPGLTDTELPTILEAVAEAGASTARWVLLRLPYQLKDLFLDWLQRTQHPDRARKIESFIRQSRGGKLYDAGRFTARGQPPQGHNRRRGKGPIAEQIAQNFDVFTRRFGLNRDVRPMSKKHFRRPSLDGQMGLFG